MTTKMKQITRVKKNLSQKTPIKSRSVKFMTKLGFIPVHIEK